MLSWNEYTFKQSFMKSSQLKYTLKSRMYVLTISQLHKVIEKATSVDRLNCYNVDF